MVRDHPEYTPATIVNGGTSGALVNGSVDPAWGDLLLFSHTIQMRVLQEQQKRCMSMLIIAESCTSLTLPLRQPFRINVRVFDHLGPAL